MVTLARTSAKRIPGMVADLGIGHAGVDGCGRYSDTSFRWASRVMLQRLVGQRTEPHRSRCELNRRYSSTDASISDFRMETLSTLIPIGKRFSRA